jgi:hypothetical protein
MLAMSLQSRRNRIAVLIAVAVLAAITAFLFRPAAVLGVKAGLAESVAGELRETGVAVDDFGRQLARHCAELPASNDYMCSIESVDDVGSGTPVRATRYRVAAGFFGCWEAEKSRGQGAGRGPMTLEGCIDLLDY